MRQDTHAQVPAATELLAHAELLRALARGILRDEHGANRIYAALDEFDGGLA